MQCFQYVQPARNRGRLSFCAYPSTNSRIAVAKIIRNLFMCKKFAVYLIFFNKKFLLMDKKSRFNAAIDHLMSIGRIHKQKDIAEAMQSTEGNVSLARKGNPKVLTDNFLMRFLMAFPDIFSMQWLFTGSGTMLINDSASASAPVSNSPSYAIPDLPPVMAAEPTPLTDRDLLAATYTTLVRLADSFRDYQSRTESRIRELESLISQLLPNVSPQTNNSIQNNNKIN